MIVDIISFEGTREDDEEALRRLDAAWVKMEYVVYGHHGRTTQSQHAVLPLSFPRWKARAPGGDSARKTARTRSIPTDGRRHG